MLNLSNTFTNLISARNIDMFLTVSIHLPDVLRYTTAPFEITFNSNTYSPGAFQLNGISFPKSQTEVHRDEMTMEIGDANANNPTLNSPLQIRNLLEANSTGIQVIVTLLLRNGTDFTTNNLTIYDGIISNFSYDVRDDTRTCTISCFGAFYKLSQTRLRNMSPAIQKSVDSTDTCFDYVDQDNNGLPFIWGGGQTS